MNSSTTRRNLATGQANLSASLMSSWRSGVDKLLLARKGELYLCCHAGVDAQALCEVFDAYYSSTSFDVLPCLQASIEPLLRVPNPTPIAALVTRGVDVSILASDGIRVMHVKENSSYELLRGQHPPADAAPSATRLYRGQARMAHGDCVVAWSPTEGKPLTAEQVQRTVQRSPSSQRAAQRLSRAQRGGPVLIIEAPALRPARDLGPIRENARSSQEHAQMRVSPRRSPIGMAAVILVLALAGFYFIQRPNISQDDWAALGAWLLTPAATATSAQAPLPVTPPPPTRSATATRVPQPTQPSETAAPTSAAPASQPQEPTLGPSPQSWSPPANLSPGMDEQVGSGTIALRWIWDGELAEDEHFDVRLWVMGAEPKSIAWTREKRYNLRQKNAGWHTWQVALIQGHDGIIEAEHAVSRSVNFYWAAGDAPKPEPTATLVPPTRVNPELGPTRGTPPANESDE